MIRRLLLLLPCIIFLHGCAVFEPVGSFFAQGYRNTVAYFNTFYNAKRLFADAEEDYFKAYRTYQQAVRDGSTASFRVPAGASQKFNSVIEKCSQILNFQAESDYVQDALFLIARSYDYLGETVKAERKYSELLAQFPETDYRIEAVARLGGVLILQDRPDEALVLLEQAEQEAVTAQDDDILPFILERLAVLHRDAGDYDTAHSYYERLHALSADNADLVSALIDYARLQLDVGLPEEALKIARNVGDLTDDQFYLYDARTTEVKALRDMRQQEEALQRIDESIEDFRFLQQRPSFQLLHADVLFEMGRESEAVEEYTFIDTSFARRGPGASAAFALGGYHVSRGEYAQAKDAFQRASGVAASPMAGEARRQLVNVTRYVALLDRFWQADSVLAALEDSIESRPDPRIDSMETLRASIMQDMGDWHFADGLDSDSAYYWLLRSVETGKMRPQQARALFIMADVAAAHPDSGYGEPEPFYRRIERDFPTSAYADEARRRLGIEEETPDDPGYELYREAEQMLENGQPEKAAGMFDSLGRVHPASVYALRGVFAAGWVYEYYLSRNDSAAVRYDRVIRSGMTEPFVNEARTRLAVVGAGVIPPPAIGDTTLVLPSPERDEVPARNDSTGFEGLNERE